MQAEHSAILCPHYERLPGSRLCTSYLNGGGCARADTFMCTEYVRKNPSRPTHALGSERTTSSRSAATTTAPVNPQRDLFGQVVRVQPSSTRAESKPSGSSPVRKPAQTEPSLTRPMAEEQIAALEERGLELCVRSAAVDELWLVPAYTGARRNEMTFRDAAAIAAMCAVFPGAEVTRFERVQEKGDQT